MYLKHFGLRELPFGLTPDTSFFFACSSYQEALNTLLVAARNGEGFIKIVGEVGNGKTLLCRKFLATLNQGERNATTAIGTQDESGAERTSARFITAYIPNPTWSRAACCWRWQTNFASALTRMLTSTSCSRD